MVKIDEIFGFYIKSSYKRLYRDYDELMNRVCLGEKNNLLHNMPDQYLSMFCNK